MSWQDEQLKKERAADRTHSVDSRRSLQDESPGDECRQNLVDHGNSAGSVDTEWKPFPVEVLPEPIRSFVLAGAKAIACDLTYILLPLLAALASAIGNACRLRLKPGWDVPPIVWTVPIGESGSAKSPGWKLAMQPVREIERELEYSFRSRKSSDDDAIEERWTVTDTTVEALAPLLADNPRGLLLSRDELSGWLASFDQYRGRSRTSSDAAHWLSMYSGQSIRVDRKTGNPRSISVASAALSVCGTIQPGVLHRALGAEHRENGMLARLLLVWPPRQVRRWTDAGIGREHIDAVRRVLERLRGIEPARDRYYEPFPVALKLTDDASRLFRQFFDANAEILASATGDYAAAVSKLEELPARLALILQLARWAADDGVENDIVDADSMSAAITMTVWFRRETQRVYRLLASSAEHGQRNELIDWIRSRGGRCTVRELQNGKREFSSSAAVAEAALQSLVDASFGYWEPVPSGPSGGQPTRLFVLNS
jgi:hypothetical protein